MIKPLSFAIVKLEIFDKGRSQARKASGFVIEADHQHYLITNWQVLSGKDFFTGKPLSAGIKPVRLKTSIHIRVRFVREEGSVPDRVRGFRKVKEIELYDEEKNPGWFELRGAGERQLKADLAALPIELELPLLPRLGVYRKAPEFDFGGRRKRELEVSALPLAWIDTGVEYRAGDKIHVVGYPTGLPAYEEYGPASPFWQIGLPASGENHFTPPFWKTGFIASEAYGLSTAGPFFIDAGPGPGMTGSPVIGIKDSQPKLLGVYSDGYRVEAHPYIGLAWPASFIKTLVDRKED